MYSVEIPASYWGRSRRSAQQQEDDIARQIAQHILFRQMGDMDLPETWVAVAEGLGCRVHPFYRLGGKDGEYAPADHGRGVIVYNTALSPLRQARVLVHEIAHHLLMPLIPGYVLGENVTCGYDDDPGDLRHRIARMVEHLCFRRT